MQSLRSAAFKAAFYINIIFWMILLLPAMLLPTAWLWRLVGLWSRINILLMTHIAGVKVEIRGLEHLPKTGALIASKHQSTFETIALLHLFHDAAFILKRELTWIPLFGWFAMRLNMISVDRAKGREALRAMTRRAGEEMRKGRHILIYPEGTRRPPGAEPDYKFGVAYLYRESGMPMVPVALNSGLFWPRRGPLTRQGTLVVEFLPAIEPGLSMQAAFGTLRDRIETASDRLMAEAGFDVPPRPQPAPADNTQA